MFLTSPNLSPISHGFFTRKGGVSDGIYASLNCGWGSQDHPSNVVENRRRVAAALGAAAENLCSLYQVHGAEVITVTGAWSRAELPKADAMVTSQKGLALGILTADCVPVLFADAKAGVIAAAHAGWRGALASVLEATVDAMCAIGAKPSQIASAIGPCIAQKSYEVGQEFYDTLIKADAGNVGFFINTPAGKRYFDIKAYVRKKLEFAGITTINILENDTYLEEDNFFSFRRTTHRSEKDYGRQISAIMLT
jgi:polyphenol oxidase